MYVMLCARMRYLRGVHIHIITRVAGCTIICYGYGIIVIVMIIVCQISPIHASTENLISVKIAVVWLCFTFGAMQINAPNIGK